MGNRRLFGRLFTAFVAFTLTFSIQPSFTKTSYLSPSSDMSVHYEVFQELKKIEQNLHPLLGLPAVKLLAELEAVEGDLLLLDDGFWPKYEALRNEYERIMLAPSGWVYDKYPALRQTDGKGTVLSITADLMLEHPELIGLGTGGLGVLKRDDTFAFGEAFGNEDYFLVAPFYNERSNQVLDEKGQQTWAFQPVDKAKAPVEEVGIIRIPYGFDEYKNDDLNDPEKFEAFKQLQKKRVASGEIPPTSRFIYVKVWKAKMGKGNLLLLDTDIDENEQEDRYVNPEKAAEHFSYLEQFGFERNARHDRDIMSRIYPKEVPGKDSQRQRFKQFVILSLGSFKAFQLVNKDRGIERPTFLHLNDPHVAPAAAKVFADDFYEDVLTVYTNHTLVKGAGTQWFHPDERQQNEHQRKNIWFHPTYYLPFHSVPGVSPVFQRDGAIEFSQAAESIVADMVKFGRVNAVNSDEHGPKLQEQKQDLYQMWDNLVGVDNGVDINWAPPEFRFQWEGLTPEEIQSKLAEFMDQLDDETIAEVKRKGKKDLVRFIEERYGIKNAIDPTKMLVVFAKRINAYKRPKMVLEIVDQIKEALKDRGQDEVIQIIFSGKSNDNDKIGERLVQEIVKAEREFEGRVKVLYLPDYHIEVAQKLLVGADFWLNTPRRHKEASGTSLLKGLINATPLISTQSGAALHKAFFEHGENALLVDVNADPKANGEDVYERHPEDLFVEEIEKGQLAKLMVEAHDLFYRAKKQQKFRSMRRKGIAKLYEVSSLRQGVDQIDRTFIPLLVKRDFKKDVDWIEASPVATGGAHFEVDVDLGSFSPKHVRVGVLYQDSSMTDMPWEEHFLDHVQPIDGRKGAYKFKAQIPLQQGEARYVVFLEYKAGGALSKKVFADDLWIQEVLNERQWFFKDGRGIRKPGYGQYNKVYVLKSADTDGSRTSLGSSI